jgi:hypothetical protein
VTFPKYFVSHHGRLLVAIRYSLAGVDPLRPMVSDSFAGENYAANAACKESISFVIANAA